ncbi:site-specific integrase [Candidimonas nitroreducens]|uniref:Integrase n=1 Tax=Candidimonas nitroreducens TaxID=683354 RepID=A0A225MT79_9BURK|nr:site-specific integrase [Candidimonas nitroreducens]OWT61869.1 integrase [Candidimonas nitroreducens]
MATISKHGERFKCQVRLKGFPHTAKSFRDRAEAEEWGRDTETAIREGTYEERISEPPPRTIREMLQRYQAEVSPGKADNGQSDKARIKRLQATLGAYSVHTLQSTRLARYKADRLAQGAAAQTVLHELVILHHAYRTACDEWGLQMDHAIPRTKRPRLPPGRDQRIRPEALQAIRKATGSKLLGDVIEFAIETCMRRTEITSLTPDHVSLENRTAFLPKTKNGMPRLVPLTPRAVELLRPRMESTGTVFGIEPNSLSRAFCRATRRAGYPKLRFHDTRHEGISRMFERGLGVLEVAKISGHKTLSQLNRYTHLDVSSLVEKLARAVEPHGSPSPPSARTAQPAAGKVSLWAVAPATMVTYSVFGSVKTTVN